MRHCGTGRVKGGGASDGVGCGSNAEGRPLAWGRGFGVEGQAPVWGMAPSRRGEQHMCLCQIDELIRCEWWGDEEASLWQREE